VVDNELERHVEVALAQFMVLSYHLAHLEGLMETTKNLTLDSVLTKIQTKHLLTTNHKCCQLS
jgi:hypothetical protein